MSLGPGKYDELCTLARVSTLADGAIVIVLGGLMGSGFAVQMAAETAQEAAHITRALASMLRGAAAELDADAARLENPYEGDATSGAPPGDAQKGPS